MAKKELPIITNKQKALRKMKTEEGTKQMRKQYTQMRDVAQKRLKRAQSLGYNLKMEIPTLKEIGSEPGDLAAEYSKLSKYLESKSSHFPELIKESEKRVESFHKLGYEFVTMENELTFGAFMGYMIQKYTQDTEDGKTLLYDSDLIVEGYDYVREHTKTAHHATISRLFNQFLRKEGYDI